MTEAETMVELLIASRKADRYIGYLETETVERRVSYAELYERALGILWRLQRFGLSRGDHLIVLLNNNNKRTLLVNEVTSSDPMIGLKRPKVIVPPAVVEEEANLHFVGTDDQRKKQIRDSNREAARRCRERPRWSDSQWAGTPPPSRRR